MVGSGSAAVPESGGNEDAVMADDTPSSIIMDVDTGNVSVPEHTHEAQSVPGSTSKGTRTANGDSAPPVSRMDIDQD